MKKILNTIAKHDNISMLCILLIMITAFSFYIQLDANDELWNFSNVYKMVNGFEIYKDLNIIITPLFFYVGKLFFSIFGANYLSFRIYEIVIVYMCLFFTIYKLFKKLEIRKLNAFLYTILIATVCLFILLDPGYNMIAIFIALIGIIIEINKKDKKEKTSTNILQGIIMFLVFMSKQNIGFYYIAGTIIYKILNNIKIRDTIKSITIQLLTAGILLLTFLVYLYSNNNLHPFINYTVLGIGEFAVNNKRINIENILLIVVEILISISLIAITFIKRAPIKETTKRNIRILSTMSIFMNFIVFPMVNKAHALIASIFFIISIIYFMDTIIIREIFIGKKIDNIKKIFITIIILVFGVFNIYFNFKYIREMRDINYYFSKQSPYYGSIYTQETINEIEEICNYINNTQKDGYGVKIISYYSNLYMNLYKRNNGDMDLPFYGNMGKDGEDGMITKISKLEKTKVLILTKDDEFYQESKKITNYIKQNLEYEGTINRFSIYNVE